MSSNETDLKLYSYQICEIIKYLQDADNVKKEELLQIEWGYLELLAAVTSKIKSKTLEKELSSNPKFFCELIRILYRSKRENVAETKQKQEFASNVWHLFKEWSLIVGLKL